MPPTSLSSKDVADADSSAKDAPESACTDGDGAAAASTAVWRMPDEVANSIISLCLLQDVSIIKNRCGLLQGKSIADVLMSIMIDAMVRFACVKSSMSWTPSTWHVLSSELIYLCLLISP